MGQIANKPHLAYKVENKCFNTPIYDWKTFSFVSLFPSEDDRTVKTAGQ
jgi:hypothetical protein